MNASKVLSLLSRSAALGVVAALVAFAASFHALAVFGLAAGLWVVLVAASDYSPRAGYAAVTAPMHLTYRLPLAA